MTGVGVAFVDACFFGVLFKFGDNLLRYERELALIGGFDGDNGEVSFVSFFDFLIGDGKTADP